MKHIALVAASTLLTIAGLSAALADDPYPVQNQDEAIAVERDRADGVNAIQPDPYFYGNNRGTRRSGADAYDRSNDDPHTVIYSRPSGSNAEAYDRGRADADAQHEDQATEAYQNGRADQARDDADYP